MLQLKVSHVKQVEDSKNLNFKRNYKFLICVCLQIVSNGKYKSAEHRVRTTNTKSRVSIPVFTIPKPTEKIAPLPQVVEKDGIAHYKEFVLADYMKNFFGNAHDGKKSLDFAKINSA